ncbi:MAG TPA: PA14 domain-containing protein [Candidatus Saccharimonadales bacterium]|nr:PA14 domain-containing protein [Candidatus Saccharimonadales bacterium]
MREEKIKLSKLKSYFYKASFFCMALMSVLSLVPTDAIKAIAPPHTNIEGSAEPIDASNIAPIKETDKTEVPAADYGKVPFADGMGAQNAPEQNKKDRKELFEDETKRTAFSNEYVNSDGTRTIKSSPVDAINYKEGDTWRKIEHVVNDDEAYVPSKNLDDSSFWDFLPWTNKSKAVDAQAGRTKAKLRPFAEGISYEMGGKTFTLEPVDARNVKPRISTVADGRVTLITYVDAWPGVDVLYELHGESVKESIIIKNANARTDYEFKVSGATLFEHPTIKGALAIEGLDPEFYMISPLSVNVNKQGLTTEQVAAQTTDGSKIKVTLDQKWFSSQPQQSFPIVIDPTVSVNSAEYGFYSYKSDGYSCTDVQCGGPNVGALYDSSWKNWRSLVRLPFEQLRGKQLLFAELGMDMAQRPYWTGTTDAKTIYTTYAQCIGYQCASNIWHSSASMATGVWMNITNTIQGMIDANQWGGWLILWGEEGNSTSYKQLEYSTMEIRLTYTTPAPIARPVEPSNQQVVVTTQPNLKVGTVADAEGEQVEYNFKLATGADAESGTVAASGWSPSNLWTVPDGVLQDGVTYYWHTYTKDGNVQTNPDWVSSFKVDMRTGKDSTQAYDTVGPLSVDIATGNLTTSNASHSVSALGGSLGVGMSYNSPMQSRQGLYGEYWNNTNFSGNPVLGRVDPEVDFKWGNGSPATGAVNADNFAVRWTGYFVAPSTGDFYIGADVDDSYNIYLNNQLHHSRSGAGSEFGATPVSLTEGQIIPIKVEMVENYGLAVMSLRMKKAGGEPQIIPSSMLQTGVRQVGAPHGLIGRYYYDSGNHNFPTNPNEAFLVRNDSLISFNWGSGSPVPSGPANDFLVRWTGYVTVPETGVYQFGSRADDGVRIKLGIGSGGSDQTVHDKWIDSSAVDSWGGDVSLTAGQVIPITVEYYEYGGDAVMELKVRRAAGVGEQTLPSTWLIPSTMALPAGWSLSVDPDGGLSYDRMKLVGNNVVLYDSTGSTHEYTWTGSGYKPPLNEDGYLVRNQDGTYTMQDVDGRTYVFNADGTLKETVTPTDDRKPAALKYEYTGTPSRLTKIIDGVTNDRFTSLHYSGDSECSGAPSGFDAQAPAGMLCAVKTSDNAVTKIWYKQNRLARIVRPGGETTDYGYDTFGRIVSVRDPLASDALAAGVRSDNDELLTQVAYDSIGRVSALTQPAATAGANRLQKTYDYGSSANAIWYDPTIVTGETPAGNPALVNFGPGKLAMFARFGADELKYRFYENGAWGDWLSLGTCMRSDPAAASWTANRIDVFIRGCDDQLYTRVYIDGTWNGFVALGSNQISSSPSATTWGNARIDVVARATDNRLMHRNLSATGWSNFSYLDGCLSDAPSVSTWGYDRLNVFANGCDNPSTVYTRNYSAGWQNFQQTTDQKITSAPQSVSALDKKIHMAAKGPANELRYLNGYEYNANDLKWSWQTLQPCMQGSPAITMDGTTVAIVYKGCDGKMYQTRRAQQGTTKVHVTGDSEPNGYNTKVQYDNLFRTIKNYDKTGNVTVSEWDSVKDLLLSTTGATGQKSTTIYDVDDRATDSYGAAPKEWFGSDRKPLAANVNQVPHVETKFDEGIWGPQVTWYNFKQGNPSTTGSFVGAPKLHTTGFGDAAGSHVWAKNMATAPITADAGMDGIGFSATGKLRVTQTGTYTITSNHDDAARVWVDDKLVFDRWSRRTETQDQVSGQVSLQAGKVYRLRYDYANIGAAGYMDLQLNGPGRSAPLNHWTNYLAPGYNLATTNKVYDATLGDIETKTNYGSEPQYGLVQSATLDPTGLNYSSGSTFEAPGTGFLRQTSKTLPGGGTTTYTYNSATETADNPCTGPTEAIHQAGFIKQKIEADPDGAGTQTARTQSTVYDAAGRAVAVRFNNDPWTCTTFDTRGRVTQATIPTINGRAGRTTTTTYSYTGNPFKTQTVDSVAGTTESEIDLLGRAVSSIDVFGNVSTLAYDNLGRVTTKTSPIGTEGFSYDTYGRPTEYLLNSVKYATTTYDQYSRVQDITYDQAKDASNNKLKLEQLKRDSLDRNTGAVFRFSNGLAFDESVTRSQSGLVTSYSDTFDAKTAGAAYTYDKAGRLLEATVDTTKYTYGYAAPSSSVCNQASANLNANKNSNRTTYTVTNTQTSQVVQSQSYCYDQSDRLISTSDSQIGTPTYDDHGNTVSLAGNSNPITFTYDASDQNTAIGQGQNKVEYLKTAVGSVLRKKEYENNVLVRSYRNLSGGSVMQSCSLTNDSDCQTTDTYLSLPGGLTLTLSPTNPDTNKQIVYSIKNFHGDSAITASSTGLPTSSVFLYEPFGQATSSTTFSTNSNPQNSSNQTLGWAASPTRKQESLFSIPIVQMGARVYLPTLGRFLQVDPIEGGTANSYVYAGDPVNADDYSGMAIPQKGNAKWLNNYPHYPLVYQQPIIYPLINVRPKPAMPQDAGGLVAGAISLSGDVSSGFKRQSSVYGQQLQRGSSIAGRNLRSVSQLAKNPAIRAVGKYAGPIGASVEFAGNYFAGDSLGRNVLKTGGGVALGGAGVFVGGVACGTVSLGTGGIAAVTCPVLVGGLGAAGSVAGNKFGEGLADVFGW